MFANQTRAGFSFVAVQAFRPIVHSPFASWPPRLLSLVAVLRAAPGAPFLPELLGCLVARGGKGPSAQRAHSLGAGCPPGVQPLFGSTNMTRGGREERGYFLLSSSMILAIPCDPDMTVGEARVRIGKLLGLPTGKISFWRNHEKLTDNGASIHLWLRKIPFHPIEVCAIKRHPAHPAFYALSVSNPVMDDEVPSEDYDGHDEDYGSVKTKKELIRVLSKLHALPRATVCKALDVIAKLARDLIV